MIIYNKLRKDIGQILRMLIERKPGCKVLEAEAYPDHIDMWLEIQLKYSVAEFMGYFKKTQIWNINLGIGNFGQEVVLQIQLGKTKK